MAEGHSPVVRLNGRIGQIRRWIGGHWSRAYNRFVQTKKQETNWNAWSAWDDKRHRSKREERRDCEIVKMNKRTAWVRLPDGNIVKRKLGRDLVLGDG